MLLPEVSDDHQGEDRGPSYQYGFCQCCQLEPPEAPRRSRRAAAQRPTRSPTLAPNAPAPVLWSTDRSSPSSPSSAISSSFSGSVALLSTYSQRPVPCLLYSTYCTTLLTVLLTRDLLFTLQYRCTHVPFVFYSLYIIVGRQYIIVGRQYIIVGRLYIIVGRQYIIAGRLYIFVG